MEVLTFLKKQKQITLENEKRALEVKCLATYYEEAAKVSISLFIDCFIDCTKCLYVCTQYTFPPVYQRDCSQRDWTL